jgi:hypothetical protein
VGGDPIGVYSPTWVEWAITAGSFAAFILVFVVLSKIVPMVSVSETREGEEEHGGRPPAPSEGKHAPPTKASVVGLVATEAER